MTDQIKKYLELAEKATPGPWYIEGSEVRYDCSPYATEEGIADCTVQICDVGRISEKLDANAPDREFIAASRTMGPALAKALIRAVETLKGISQHPKDRYMYRTTKCLDPETHADAALDDIEKILGGGE